MVFSLPGCDAMSEKKPEVIELEPIALDVKAAAKMVCLSAGTLNDMRMKGDGPPFTYIRGCVRYPVDSLREWAMNRPRFRSITEAELHAQMEGR